MSRKLAYEVNIGDEILTYYKPRTWQRVTEVEITKSDAFPVRIDTATDRTHWKINDLVPCRSREADLAADGKAKQAKA